MTRTATRTCPLCEATCGLVLTLEGEQVVRVRGDEDDPGSHGYVCPKGIALGELHHDPDRLRHPLVRDGGVLRRAGWDEAFARAREGLRAVIGGHGADAVGIYLGNPNVHNVASTFYVPVLVRALGTRYRFSASTVDQLPQQVAAGLLFGTELSVPVPDVDRTDLLLVLGANPLVSNGSMLTAPDLPGRLRALRRRGGRLIVVDPVRTRTAAAADEHVPIRPGSDALWLAALVRTVLADGPADLGAAAPHVDADQVEALRAAVAPFTPESVAALTGIDPATTRRIAAQLAAAGSAAVYGRLGTSTSGLARGSGEVVPLGTLASWLVVVLTAVTGNLDRPGGALWPLPAAGGPTTAGTPGRGRGVRIPGSQRTRVRGLPSALGEFPVAALAEEIDTPDPVTGQRLRALITVAGNPVVSTPDADRLERALAGLDLLVSVDAYVTETSRHADVVLPAPSPLARGHYDVVFAHLAVRNTAHWSPPTVPLGPDARDEGEILLRLAGIAAGANAAAADPARAGQPDPTPDQLDDLTAFEVARRAAASPAGRAHGRDPADLLAAVAPRRGVERLLDLSLRSGPYGDGFGTHPGGLDLAALEAQPHGLDLGPLRPRLPEVLRTPSGRIELAPAVLLAELGRAAALLAAPSGPDGSPSAGSTEVPGLVLVGRRQVRSNNSWLHNLPALSGGSTACRLQVHPADAERLGLVDGAPAWVRGPAGEVEATVEVTAAVAVGVVSLPHGWGHDHAGTWGAVARRTPGVNVNRLTPSGPVDPLSGTAVLSGYPVTVGPVGPVGPVEPVGSAGEHGR